MRLAVVVKKFFLISLDKSLAKSTGLGMQRFQAQQHNFWIGPGDKLGFAELSDENMILGSADRRAWVLGSSGEPLRELVPRTLEGELYRPTLHKVQDQSAIGGSASLFCGNVLGLGSTTTPDPFIRWHGRVPRHGITKAGAWIIVLEPTVLFNTRSAPWQSAQFFSILSEIARKYFIHRALNCPIYLLLYEQICQERNETVLDRGTPEHQAKLRKDLQNLEVFHQNGTRAKLGRWGSWCKACRSWQGQRGACLPVLLYEGANQCWWKDAQSLPLMTLG